MLIVLASQPTLLIKYFFLKKIYHELHVGFHFSQERDLLGVVIHACNFSTWKLEA